MKKIIFIIFISIILYPYIASAEISVSLKLDRYEAALTDSVKMTVSISGSRDAESPGIYGLDNFTVRNAGSSTRIQIVNGRVSSNLDYTYFLQPKKIGTFTIGPALAKVEGKVHQSSAVILLVKASLEQKGASAAPVFLTASLSANRVYLEEQLLYTIRLYHISGVSNISLSMPEADGLAFKQLGKPAEYNTVYNARNYQVIEIRYSLVPSKTGRFNINPARMSMLVSGPQKRQDDTDDFFSMDDFFPNVRGRPVTLAGNPLVLDVLPVLEIGKPADYAGLVGSFQISAELAPDRIRAGESATFTVVLRGAGNVNRMPDIKMPDMKNAKVYSDEPKLEIRQSEKGLEGIKTMKWAIVPEKEGQYAIPSLSVSYFDTAKKVYSSISTRSFALSVDPGTGVMAQSPFTKEKALKSGKEAVEELGKDILPIHRSANDLSRNSSGNIGLLYWLFIFFPALAYSLFIAGFKLTKRTPENEARLKAVRAAGVFYKICRDKDLSANMLSNALREYFNSRFGMELGLLSQNEAANILRSHGCHEETIKQMEWSLKKIETLIYTGKGEEPCDLSEEAMIIVKSIEKEIK